MFKKLLSYFFREPVSQLRLDMNAAIADGRPPPGCIGYEICKEYDKDHDGPTPCMWPYCECTKVKHD